MCGPLCSSAAHDGGLGRQPALEDLVPANQPAAVDVEEALDPLGEPAL
jgi:hypothetical protein